MIITKEDVGRKVKLRNGQIETIVFCLNNPLSTQAVTITVGAIGKITVTNAGYYYNAESPYFLDVVSFEDASAQKTDTPHKVGLDRFFTEINSALILAGGRSNPPIVDESFKQVMESLFANVDSDTIKKIFRNYYDMVNRK